MWCDSKRNNTGVPVIQATAPAWVLGTPVSPPQHQQEYWCACCSHDGASAMTSHMPITPLMPPPPCHTHTGTSTPVTPILYRHRHWYQHPCPDYSDRIEALAPAPHHIRTGTSTSNKNSAPTTIVLVAAPVLVPAPRHAHTAPGADPGLTPRQHQASLTDPAMRMMMRSGSRAMVKMKSPKAGPKAMKVHPKKTASVISAGAGTRDRGRTRSSDRTGPAAPSPSAALPGPMTSHVRAPPPPEAASRGGLAGRAQARQSREVLDMGRGAAGA